MKKKKLHILLLTLWCLSGLVSIQAAGQCNAPISVNNDPGQCGAVVNYNLPASYDTLTFNYTGAVQTWGVPAGVTSIIAEVYGAQGGDGWGSGGLGGLMKASFSVSTGQTLTIYVGGRGGNNVGGFNGGGNTSGGFIVPSGGGGGASDIRTGSATLNDRIIVGGGGGGSDGGPGAPSASSGGSGGGLNGESGGEVGGGISLGAAGGTQTGPGGNGDFGQGGNGILVFGGLSGGGGGGGWYGGGGTKDFGGGGGSGFIAPAGTVLSTQNGVRGGNGLVYIIIPTTVAQVSGLASGSLFPVGTTTNKFNFTHYNGNITTCSFTVTVNDVTTPVISQITQSKYTLTPPNHKMQTVIIDYNSGDNCGSVTTSLSVTSNEPINGTGSGDVAPDWVVVDKHKVQLRAERSGNGNGRIYTITITATDASGNQSSQTVTVKVPLNSTLNSNTSITSNAAAKLYNNHLQVSAAPNPATNFITVHINGFTGSVLLKLMDLQGKVLKTAKLQTNNSNNVQQPFNVADVTSGTYFMVAVDEKGNKQTIKVVIAH